MPRAGARWSASAATLLATSRLPFAVGVAFGLASALALRHGRLRWGLVLAVLSTLVSPVAGLFLAMAGAAYALAARGEDPARVPEADHALLARARGRARAALRRWCPFQLP